jgi:6-phosphofructokinase 1
MSGLATGAEREYIHEEGVSLKDLQVDVENLVTGFKSGKRLGLIIRNEFANKVYTTSFMCSLFEEEGKDAFDVRQAILGHLQQGGDPSPFDRIHATRLAVSCIDYLIDKAMTGSVDGAFVGLLAGKLMFHNLEDFPRMIDEEYQRPKVQWWLDLRPVARLLSQPVPSEPFH